MPDIDRWEKQDVDAIIRSNRAYLDIDEVAHAYTFTLPDELDWEEYVHATIGFKQVVAQLSYRFQRVIMLYTAGFTQHEIGSMYQVSQSTISRWLWQIREQL